MRNRFAILALLLLLTAVPANASAYDILLCPPVLGHFLLRGGELWLAIVEENDKPVEERTEKIANPLDDRSHEVLVKRGQVKVEVHQDKDGGLFVHWGTLTDDKE